MDTSSAQPGYSGLSFTIVWFSPGEKAMTYLGRVIQSGPVIDVILSVLQLSLVWGQNVRAATTTADDLYTIVEIAPNAHLVQVYYPRPLHCCMHNNIASFFSMGCMGKFYQAKC